LANKKFYWDACVWIGLINQEADKLALCENVIALAVAKEIEIWTSTLSLAEVFKKKCAGTQIGIAVASDEAFESFLSQDYVGRVQVDSDVGLLARRLLRTYSQLAKPADAIHLATALLNNVDEFHTFDGENLLSLDGQIDRADGTKLKICKPPAPPDPNAGTLFEGIENDNQSASGAA
jgi:predicted nucleic acid-binding protein